MVKQNPAEAITYYRNAISLLCEVGRFGTAGRIQRKLAEWFEDDRNFDECVDQYRQASDYYLGDNMVDQSDICLIKCAYYQGLLEEFDEAAEIYAAVGLRGLDNNLLKFNSRDYFLRTGLLYLAGGDKWHGKLKSKLMDFKTGDAR
jgi:alpha-soluble NSF attachment protein